MVNTVTPEIRNEILEHAARFQYESYGSLMTYHAFLMGLGEVEARLLTDIDLQITQEIDKEINDRVQALSKASGVKDHEENSNRYRGQKVVARLAGAMRGAVIINLLPKGAVLVECYCPSRQEFEVAEGKWQDSIEWNDPKQRRSL